MRERERERERERASSPMTTRIDFLIWTLYFIEITKFDIHQLSDCSSIYHTSKWKGKSRVSSSAIKRIPVDYNSK